MKTNYVVGDFLTRIKNVAMAKGKHLEVVVNRQTLAIAQALKKLGYLSEVKKDKAGAELVLAYKNKTPVLANLKLVSKPGLRVYMRVQEIEAKRGPSVYIISTPKGILSSKEAIKQRLGGEVIAEIW